MNKYIFVDKYIEYFVTSHLLFRLKSYVDSGRQWLVSLLFGL